MEPSSKFPPHFKSFGCSTDPVVDTDVESEEADKFSGLGLNGGANGVSKVHGLAWFGFNGMLSNLNLNKGFGQVPSGSAGPSSAAGAGAMPHLAAPRSK